MGQAVLSEELLKKIVNLAEKNQDGDIANYIPELANINKNLTALAVYSLKQNKEFVYNNDILSPITLQSTAKLIPLIGLLEEFGAEFLFKWVRVEPSGDDFASITRLEQFGPKPSNPMLNPGAITLCSRIPGVGEQKIAWLEYWVKKLFKQRLNINPLVYASEKRTGDRNRALAYLLQSRHNLGASVETTLDLYFSLCSYEAYIDQLLYLPSILANGGLDPVNNSRVLSEETVRITLAIMATCGLYDETGTHMVRCGMPAKSGVSGYTIAVVPGKAGIITLNPRINKKGNSIRGEIMLEALSKEMKWHFAIP